MDIQGGRGKMLWGNIVITPLPTADSNFKFRKKAYPLSIGK
jgi:hypothetical protein